METLAILPTLCNRCGHVMWYDETKKKWYCTNPKCKKYKEPPVTQEPSDNNESEGKDE